MASRFPRRRRFSGAEFRPFRRRAGTATPARWTDGMRESHRRSPPERIERPALASMSRTPVAMLWIRARKVINLGGRCLNRSSVRFRFRRL